jgi:hypothetical protein
VLPLPWGIGSLLACFALLAGEVAFWRRRVRPRRVAVGTVGRLVRRLAAVCALALALAAPAAASSPEQQLADRYAPVMMLKQQTEACGPGEPYEPTTVDLVLGNPEVVLRDPDGNVVTDAPTAADLWGLPEGYYLDLPGNPLKPGCSYEQQFDAWSAGKPSSVYAHVLSQRGVPDRLALQYWFFYTFNDFNDKHEGDWEMIQLVFDAPDAEAALKGQPAETIYSQHGGGETAAWESSKLQKDGTHPLVYPGSGSHANYYSQNIFLGRSASEGFGCDNTSAPSREVRPQVILMPDTSPAKDSSYAWLAFDGRWGQKEKGANNGPTGPNTKQQWTEPITWMDETGRDSSVTVPAHSVLGPNVSSFFCKAVARGSNLLNLALRSPWLVLALALLALAFTVTLNRRTSWRPVDLQPIARARTVGQMLRVAWRIRKHNRALCLGVGLVFLAVTIVVDAIRALLTYLTGIDTYEQVAGAGNVTMGVLSLLMGAIGVAIGAVVATAAMAAFTAALADGRVLTAREAFAVLRGRGRPLLRNSVFIAAVATLLAISVVGIPLAVWLLVRWAVSNQAIVLDGCTAREGRRESARLVRGVFFRTFLFTTLVTVSPLVVGSLIGVAFMLLVPSVGLWLVNLIGSILYMFVFPYVGIALTLYLYDRRLRLAGDEPDQSIAAAPVPAS